MDKTLEVSENKIKQLDNLVFVLTIVFMLVGFVSLGILDKQIHDDELFKILAISTSFIIITIGISIQEIIHKRKEELARKIKESI